ncbi:MAG: hypothetical protein A2000_05485 [Ignavibacteria bacterium GWB2_36_8]|nr:MAG: hypothetical protein A2000_05485 [Ignavibacteria bacterium GWB2_36_8]OGU49829.1 MAG: hypothetical protein A2080_04220 [Ignavibacteria bacterium GWC2_36_12]
MSEPKTIYINFYDSITPDHVKHIMASLSEIISKEKPDKIYFLFSSCGGSVEAGVVLYNFIRSLPVEIIMHNTGSIDSIANIVFLSANTRFTSDHSSFLFHCIIQPVNANTNLTKSQLQELISGINISENKIASIIAERTKLPLEEIRELFLQGEAKNPTFALQKGIVHEIKNPSIPKGTELLSFNL